MSQYTLSIQHEKQPLECGLCVCACECVCVSVIWVTSSQAPDLGVNNQGHLAGKFAVVLIELRYKTDVAFRCNL